MKIEGHYPEPDQCHSKWKALVADYLHHKSEAETTGTVPLWPFYTRVRSILDTITGPLTDTDTGIHNASKRRKKRTLGNIRKKRSVVIKQEVDRIDDDLSIGSNCNNAGVSSSNLGNITITDVDGSTGATQDQGHSPSRNEIREIHRRLTELEERIQICNRLDNLEAKLDSAQQHLEIQSETNTLLGRVLSELSRLGSGLNLRFDQGMRQESTDLGAGITIVVPNSSI
ncbi:hypothetical protein SK128_024751 [Halocaridina rubra]|uniref:Uncharacterized protein n=1 Tax=Halocaridina rubra TaxID=373956 RepID=A0AAN8XMF1_HALRR